MPYNNHVPVRVNTEFCTVAHLNDRSTACSSNNNNDNMSEEEEIEEQRHKQSVAEYRKLQSRIDISFGLTNARSLWHKYISLKEHMEEGKQCLAVVTETWFHAGEKLDELKAILRNDHGLESIDKCRPRRSASNPGGEGLDCLRPDTRQVEGVFRP